MQQIEQLKSNQTIFIIAHRVTTLKQCDIVIRINTDYTIEQVNFNQIAFNRNWNRRNTQSNKSVNILVKSILNNMQHSQLNVVDQLSEHLKGNASYLCTGKEALNTLISMKLIIDRIDKNEWL